MLHRCNLIHLLIYIYNVTGVHYIQQDVAHGSEMCLHELTWSCDIWADTFYADMVHGSEMLCGTQLWYLINQKCDQGKLKKVQSHPMGVHDSFGNTCWACEYDDQNLIPTKHILGERYPKRELVIYISHLKVITMRIPKSVRGAKCLNTGF